MVEGKVIVVVIVKSVAATTDVHQKQLQTYLTLADMRLGLLINLNVTLIKDDIKRIVKGLVE